MKKGIIFGMVLLLVGVLGVARAGAGDDPPSPEPTPTPLPAEAEAFWSQFEDAHRTTIPVEDWLAAEKGALLWEGMLSGSWFAVSWDKGAGTVCLEENGAPVDDVVTARSSSDRPTWEASFDDKAVARLRGFVDVDETYGVIVLQIVVGTDTYRMVSFGSLSVAAELQLLPVIGATSTCVCFGIGTATKTCSDADCNTGVSCGSGSKHCRWKSGSVVPAL